MSTYLVSFIVRTPISIFNTMIEHKTKRPRIINSNFRYPDQQISVSIYDDFSVHNDSTNRNGLRIDVVINSIDIESSIPLARDYADLLLSLLTTTTLAYSPSIQFDFTYDFSIDITKREYLKDLYFHELDSYVQREANISIFGSLFKGISEYQNNTANIQNIHKKTRLSRALVWLRKGLLNENNIDEFLSYWIALEALDGLLQSDKEIPYIKCRRCSKEIKICPNCKEDPKLYSTSSPLFGIEQLALECGLSHSDFRKLKVLRNKIFHADASLSLTTKPKTESVNSLVNEKTSTLRKIIIYGICKILGIPKENRDRIVTITPIKKGYLARLRIKTLIQDFAVNKHDANGYPIHPIFNWSVDINNIHTSPDEKLSFNFINHCTPLNCKWPPNCPFEFSILGHAPILHKAEFGKFTMAKE